MFCQKERVKEYQNIKNTGYVIFLAGLFIANLGFLIYYWNNDCGKEINAIMCLIQVYIVLTVIRYFFMPSLDLYSIFKSSNDVFMYERVFGCFYIVLYFILICFNNAVLYTSTCNVNVALFNLNTTFTIVSYIYISITCILLMAEKCNSPGSLNEAYSYKAYNEKTNVTHNPITANTNPNDSPI